MPNTSLDNLIQHHYFDLLVDVGKNLSMDKDKPALNVSRTTGLYWIKSVNLSRRQVICRS